MAAQPRAEAGDGSILDISRLTKLFGGLRAVSDFHMAVPEGRLYGLIGPNGAGKTTVFNMITGLYLPTEGSIVFDGRDLVGVDSHHITQAGVARTFQNIRLFQNLTVLDNVRIAYHTHAGYSRRRTSWRCSACRTASSRWPRTCRTASSAGSRSPGLWLPSRACSCWTSPLRA